MDISYIYLLNFAAVLLNSVVSYDSVQSFYLFLQYV